MKEETKGLAGASAQTLISILSFFIGKEALRTLPAGPLVLFRAVGAAAILALVLRAGIRHEPVPERRPGDSWRLAALGFFGVPLNQYLFLAGLAKTTPAHAAIVYALTPAVVLFIGWLRGTERLTRPRVVGIAIALAGVTLVLAPKAVATGTIARFALDGAPPRAPVEADALVGDLMIVGAMVAWSIYTAFAKDVVQRLGALRATAGALGWGAILYLPVGLWISRDLDLSTIAPAGWLGVAWLVIAGSGISYLSWYYALRRLDPSRIAVFNNLQPVGTALIAWAFLHEALAVPTLAGGALVITGVLLAQRAGR